MLRAHEKKGFNKGDKESQNVEHLLVYMNTDLNIESVQF